MQKKCRFSSRTGEGTCETLFSPADVKIVMHQRRSAAIRSSAWTRCEQHSVARRDVNETCDVDTCMHAYLELALLSAVPDPEGNHETQIPITLTGNPVLDIFSLLH